MLRPCRPGCRAAAAACSSRPQPFPMRVVRRPPNGRRSCVRRVLACLMFSPEGGLLSACPPKSKVKLSLNVMIIIVLCVSGTRIWWFGAVCCHNRFGDKILKRLLPAFCHVAKNGVVRPQYTKFNVAMCMRACGGASPHHGSRHRQ